MSLADLSVRVSTALRQTIRGKVRIALAWIFIAFIGGLNREYPTFFVIVIGFLGASLRYWASGFLMKDSRPAVGGPYSFVRNPLYLGSYLLALSCLVSIGNLWLILAGTLAYFSIYWATVVEEEDKLLNLFGEPYQIYLDHVPRFLPRFTPISNEVKLLINPSLQKFDSALAWKNKAYEAYVSFLGILVLLSLSAWLGSLF